MVEDNEHEFRDTLPLYAFGLLDSMEAQALEDHLRGCVTCALHLRDLREMTGQIPYAYKLAAPPPDVKAKLLASLSQGEDGETRRAPKRGLQQPLPGIFVIKEEAGEWRSTPYPGVSFKLLYADRQSRYATSLLKMEPGAKYPAHRHVGCEQCLVVEGEVKLGSVAVSKGDFEYALAGTKHGTISTDEGCLLLIIAHTGDELFT